MRRKFARTARIAIVVVPMAIAIGIAAGAHAAPQGPGVAPPTLPPLPTQSATATAVPSPPVVVPSNAPTPPPVEAPSPLGYRIHTIYKAPDGSLVDKTNPGILAIPLPVDVDGDLTHNQEPDILVQLTIDAGRATLRVTKLPNAAASLPLEVEAIVADPRGSTNLEVAFGYDALSSTAPAVFSSTIQLLGAYRVTSIALDIETAGAGPTLAVIGTVYTPGPHGERNDPQSGRIAYTPVPTAAHFAILQGSDVGVQNESEVDLVTDTPTTVAIRLEDIQGTSSSTGDIVIDKVPNALTLSLTDSTDGKKTYSYQASDVVSKLSLDLADHDGSKLTNEFSLELTGIPKHILLVQDTPTHATFTSDAPVASIAAGSSQGRGIAWLDEPAYLYTTDHGGDSFAFRILGLSRAEYDTGDPFLVDVDIAPGPFHVVIESGSRTVSARINDLPHTVRVQFSNAAGTLDYTGSDRIARILVDITDPQGVAGRAKEMHLTLDGVPQDLSLAFGTTGGKVSMDAHGDSIDKVTLLLTSGPDLAVDDGFDGVVVQDVPDHYAVAVRLTGLKLVSVTTGDAPYKLDLAKAAGPFLVALAQGNQQLRIEVHDLPDSLSATVDPSKEVSYTASAPIGLITAEGSDPDGLAGRATRLSLKVVDVPASLTLDFGSSDQVGVDAHGQRIGSIDLLMTSGPEIDVDTGYDGFVLEDVADHYALRARLTGLRLATVSSAAPYSLNLSKDAGKFLARLTQGSRYTEIKIEDLPDTLQATFDPAGSLDYVASAGIAHLAAELRDPAGLSGRATRLSLDVQGLPPSLTLALPSAGSATLDAHDSQIGVIDLLLTSGPVIAVDAGFDGVVLRDTADEYALVAHLEGLKRVSVSTGSPYQLDIAKKAGPFLVDLLQDKRSTRVEVHDLPSSLKVTFDPAGSLSYTASAPIGLVSAVVSDPGGVSGRATLVRLGLHGLPASLDVSFGTAGAIGIDAHGTAIGLIDVLMTSGPEISVPAGFDGAVLQDVSDHYALVAHITGLKLLSVSTSAPYSLNIQKTAGPFLVDLTQAARTTRVEIHDLPDSLSATLDPAGSLSYAASAGIDHLTARIADPAGVSGRATLLSLDIHQLPASLDLDLPSSSSASLDAHGSSIGLIDLLLTSGPAITVDAGFDGVVLKDTDDTYAIVVHLQGLQHVNVSTATPYSLDIAKTSTPFLVDLLQGARSTRVEVHNLPASITVTFDPSGSLSYTASDPIGELTARIADPAGVTGRATLVTLDVQGLPKALDLDLPTASAASLDAHGSSIGLIDFLMTSGPVQSVDDGYDGVLLRDTSAIYVLAARLHGLQHASVSTASPYKLDIAKQAGPFLVDLLQGARSTRVEVHDLPSSIQVTLDPSGSASYTASAPIAHLLATISDPAGVTGRATLARLQLDGLPAALDMTFGTANAVSIDAKTASIGLVDLLMTSGPDLAVPAGFDGAVLQDVTDHYAFAVHLTGLRHVSVSTGAPYALDIAKTAGPFLVDLTQGARTTHIEVHDLPSSFTATLDPAGKLSYTASASIGSVTADLADPAGVTGRATAVHLALTGLPSALDLTFSSGSSASLDAHGSQIGLIDLTMTSGPAIAVPSGFDGLVLKDTTDVYQLAVHLQGLKSANVSTDAPYSLSLQKAAGPFLVDLTQNARSTRVEIHDLPDSIQATFDPSGTLSYTASSTISTLQADIADPAGVSGRATALHLTLNGLPATLDLSFGSGTTASLDAHGASIGLIDLLATSGPSLSVDAGYDGVVLQDVPDHFALAVHMTGLKSASVSTAAPYALSLSKTAGPFIVHLTQGNRDTLVTVHDLPSTITANLDPNGTLSYTASAAIGSLTGIVTDPAGAAGRATFLRLDAVSLPSSLTLDFGTGSSMGIDAHGKTIGSISLFATSGPALSVDDGYDGVVLEDVPDHFAVAARLTGLSVARVSTGVAPYSLTIVKAPGPFVARLTQGARQTEVKVNDLPSSLTASLNPAGSLSYTASAVVGQITASISDPAGVAGRATRATALLQNVPKSLTLNWGGTNGTVSADAGGAIVGLVQVLLTSGPDLTLPADRDGLVLEDLTDHYAMFGRITGLKSVSFAQGPPPSFSVATTGGRLFQVSLATQKAGGVATTSALIDSLPTSVSVTFSSSTALQYRASSGIAHVTLDAFDPSGISGRATALHAKLDGMPTAMNAGWDSSGTITFDALGGTVGLVEVQLTSGPDDRLDAAYDGILLEDLADRYVVFARLTNLQKAIGTQSPQPDITINTTGNRVLKVDINQYSSSTGKTTYTRATLDHLTPTMHVRLADSPQRVFYDASGATSSLSFVTNSGSRWALDASLAPVPAHVYFCSDGGGACSSHGRTDAGSFAFDASQQTTINMFDCQEPVNASCVRGGSPSKYISVDNVTIKHMYFNAGADSTGWSGETWSDTDWNSVTGHIRIEQSNSIDINFGTFYAQDHDVQWSAYATFWPFGSKDGDVSCNGTSIQVKIIGIWIGITGYVC